MSRRRGRAGRLLGRALRSAAVFDRPGTRWILNALSPAPIVVLVHRGRRSGRLYRTPVEALCEDTERGEVVVSPMWGTGSDWYRNVLAGGLVETHRNGEASEVEWRELSEPERREATEAYRSQHPLYSRIILRMLVRLHRFSGDPVEAVIRGLPMLALRPTGRGRIGDVAERSLS